MTNKKKNVMLISMPVNRGMGTTIDKYIPPMGLMFLSASLELNGYSSKVIDLAVQPLSNQELIDLINLESPIFVGITTYTANFNTILNLVKIIKLNCSNISIVLGGPHVSLIPEDGMRSQYVDFLVIREGEATIVELAESISTNQSAIAYSNIMGLCYRSGSSSNKNKPRVPVRDLNILPIVKRDFVQNNIENKQIGIVTSRGCPGRCLYCAATVLSGAIYRTRDINSVFMEIVQLKSIFHKNFSILFLDDTFTIVPERVLSFVELIDLYSMDLKWWCGSRIDAMNEEIVTKMANSGCLGITYGIESGNQDVLNKIHKKIALSLAREIIGYTKNAGMRVSLNFMFGHFCDTKESMHDTLSFIKQMFFMYKANIIFSYNTPFPGTWQYQKKEELDITMPHDYDQLIVTEPRIETPNFTILDQLEIGLKAIRFLNKYDYPYDASVE
ncbi:B12-binding domain-containing radical SAM protein [Clostridia bacterium]|nr:B12-binding domain-containing radical SAM protein [Clostridia bacterium]